MDNFCCLLVNIISCFGLTLELGAAARSLPFSVGAGNKKGQDLTAMPSKR